MTSSTSSSARRIAPPLSLLCAVALAGGCAHSPRRDPAPLVAVEPGERVRIVVLPVENLSGDRAPLREIHAAIVASLERRFEVVTGDALEQFLMRRRLRHTGGIDVETARAAHDELGAHAILVSTLELYRPTPPPAFALAMRLVDASAEPAILWMDAASLAGDDSPGLLRLGVVDAVATLQQRAVTKLTGSLAAAAIDGHDGGPPRCGGAWYAPKVRYRSSLLDRAQQPTLAILPFLNQGGRRGAGEVVALEFVRHLVATSRFRILEPGVARDYLLHARVMMPGGVSPETSRLMLGALGVDLVLSGAIIDFVDNAGPQGPTIRFSATILDGGTGEVVWHSSSYNRGDDGVFAFGLGRVRTSGALSCRMVSDVVRELLTASATPTVVRPQDRAPGDFSAVRARARESAGSAGD